jgi:glutamine amidotransferase
LIRILDYGLGNLRSVEKALTKIGVGSTIQSDLKSCTKLIIPGVGAFGAAMERIAPLAAEIRSFAASGQPILGICLGQQLLFERSEELGAHAGLGLLAGNVRYLPRIKGLKVPHVGWSVIKVVRKAGVAANLEEGKQAYFVHSLYTECTDPTDTVATATYGIEFPAAVQRENIWGAQFHPEKSSEIGLQMLRAFAEC